MTRSGEPEPPWRAPLSRQRVLDAAVALADRDGVGALTMRKLAAEVGFEVMSLYHHVASKDELLDAMIDSAAQEVELRPGATSWRANVRSIAISLHECLLRHPWASQLWSSRIPGPARKRLMETLLRTLHEAALPPQAADLGFHALTNHVLGYTLQEQSFSTQGDWPAAAEAFVAGLPADEFPHLIDHVRAHIAHRAPDTGFDFVLDLILDGLEERG